MVGKTQSIKPAGPVTLAGLRDVARRTGEHVGTVGPFVSPHPDGGLAGRCIVYRLPKGRELADFGVGSARLTAGGDTPAGREVVADAAELDALLSAFPEFWPLVEEPPPGA
jgi:hypothetical protein